MWGINSYVENKLLGRQRQIILLKKKEDNYCKMTSFCSQSGSNGNQGSPRENNASITHITSLLIVIPDETWEAGGFPGRAAGLGLWPRACHHPALSHRTCLS